MRLRLLSLGAGVQSTCLLLKSCYGELPKLDGAIFADTQGEPQYVYEHLDRVTAEAARFSIPVYRVTRGNLAADLTDPARREAAIPYYTVSGSDKGRGRRNCTREYKINPINRKVRELLGAAPPAYLAVKKDRIAEQWIGFSTDEIGRVSDKIRRYYLEPRYPLLDIGFSREYCRLWLERNGWTSVAKSACSFCPFHSNAEWKNLRDNHPADWKRAVELDTRIRNGADSGRPTMQGAMYLHRSRVALAEVLLDEPGDGDPDGCSPYGCRSGSVI